jgi:hypothetical protein
MYIHSLEYNFFLSQKNINTKERNIKSCIEYKNLEKSFIIR